MKLSTPKEIAEHRQRDTESLRLIVNAAKNSLSNEEGLEEAIEQWSAHLAAEDDPERKLQRANLQRYFYCALVREKNKNT